VAKSAMVWFDLRVEESTLKSDDEIDWKGWVKELDNYGKKLARESAEWQEEALKRARIRI